MIKGNIVNLNNETLHLSDIAMDPNFINKWKIYSTPFLKQYAIASLGLYEDKTLAPIFFEHFINPVDSKMALIAQSNLKKLGGEIEDNLISLIDDSSYSQEKRAALIEIGATIKTDKMYNKLMELSNATGQVYF